MIDKLKSVLPSSGVKYFEDVYNTCLSNGSSEGVAVEVAWSAVKSKLVQGNGSLVAMSDNFETPTLFSFEMSQPEISVVTNSETEEIILDAILADTTPNTEGKFFTDEELLSISEQINSLGSTLPDVDHEKLNRLVKKYGNNYDAIVSELNKEKGIFKSIKASFEKGKLWIQAVLDKRYKNHVNKFKGLSIESLAKSDETGRLRNPRYLGFTFTNKPKLKAARIAV